MRTPLLLLALLFAPTAWAQQGDVRTWEDVIAGEPAWVTIVGPAVLGAVETASWTQVDATLSGTYVFAIGSPDNPRLIVDFDAGIDGRLEARIYASHPSPAALGYEVVDGDVRVAISPRVRVILETGRQWVEEGVPDYALEVLVDGRVGSEDVPPDGVADEAIRVAGSPDGVPTTQSRRLLEDPFSRRGYPRFSLQTRMEDAPPFTVAQPLIPQFPHLGMARAEVRWQEANRSPLFFDLRSMQLVVQSFVGFHHAGIFEINSYGYPPDVNFEAPFAFYSFDPLVREPQLVVRAKSFPAGSPLGPSPVELPRSTFRYSWRGAGLQRWTHSLTMAGPNPYRSVSEVAGARLQVPGPDELPAYVTNEAWPLVMFVEAPDGYPGAEGIYNYSAQADEVWDWLGGHAPAPPDFIESPLLGVTEADRASPIAEKGLMAGYRGEYRTQVSRPPGFYVSPIDGRLHLLWAEGGVWNLGNRRYIRYLNLDGDAYIDTWLHKEIQDVGVPDSLLDASMGETTLGIVVFDGEVLLFDEQELRVKAMDATPADSAPAVPTDALTLASFKAWWQEHAQASSAAPVDASDLRGVFASIDSPTLLRLAAGPLHHLDIDAGEARLEFLDPSACDVSATCGQTFLAYTRAAGQPEWSVSTVEGADLAGSVRFGTDPQQLMPGPVSVVLSNRGGVAWIGDIELNHTGGTIDRWEELVVPAGDRVILETVWSPQVAGQARLEVTGDGNELAALPLMVQALPRLSAERAYQLSTLNNPTLVLVLASLVLVVAFASATIMGRNTHD